MINLLILVILKHHAVIQKVLPLIPLLVAVVVQIVYHRHFAINPLVRVEQYHIAKKTMVPKSIVKTACVDLQNVLQVPAEILANYIVPSPLHIAVQLHSVSLPMVLYPTQTQPVVPVLPKIVHWMWVFYVIKPLVNVCQVIVAKMQRPTQPCQLAKDSIHVVVVLNAK